MLSGSSNRNLWQNPYDWSFPGGPAVKNPPANAGDVSLIPGLERSPREGNGKTLLYCCIASGIPMDRGVWWVQSMRLWRVEHSWAAEQQQGFTSITWGREISSGFPWEVRILGSPVSSYPWGVYPVWEVSIPLSLQLIFRMLIFSVFEEDPILICQKHQPTRSLSTYSR